MSSLFTVLPEQGASVPTGPRARVDPWFAAIGWVAALLLAGGFVTVMVGLSTIARFQNTVLGQDQGFDAAVATAIVGGAAIVLGVVVGTCWLVLGWVGARSGLARADRVDPLPH